MKFNLWKQEDLHVFTHIVDRVDVEIRYDLVTVTRQPDPNQN